MLQIISGKFFAKTDRHVFQAKGITYSNYSWLAPIETCVATLEPVSWLPAPTCAYVLNYVNQIEKEDAGRQASLVRIGDTEIVQQFECIATFGLKSLFGSDRWEIEFACRSSPKDAADEFVPQRFVPRFFRQNSPGRQEEVIAFAALVKKIIGLPRAKYLALMTCLEAVRHALQALSHNVNLAYSLVVYCLESLSQKYDGYVPVWGDYDDIPRNELDRLLDGVAPEIASRIRAVRNVSRGLRQLRYEISVAR